MTYLFDDNHTFLLMLVLIGGYKVLSFAIGLSRALPLMYYCWKVTKKCEGAYISQIGGTGYPHNIYCEGLLLSCGHTPTEAWKNAWSYLNAKKTLTP